MPTTKEVLATEDTNLDRIYLYTEGKFFKAYQQSAFMFIRDCAPFKPTKKYIKAVERHVVSIGFPKMALLRYFSPAEMVWEGENMLHIRRDPIDKGGFEEWFDGLEVKPPTQRTEPVLRTEQELAVASLTDDALMPEEAPEEEWADGNFFNWIVRTLRDFRLSDSTPMECMIFLGGVQKEIDKYYNDNNGHI